jgi:hypothetical protein
VSQPRFQIGCIDISGDVSLEGTLATMPVTDLLQFLELGRKTGTLTIERGKVAKRLSFKEGIIVAAESTDPHLHIGYFLLRRGLVSERQLRRTLLLHENPWKLVARVVVERGGSAVSQIQEAVVEMTEEVVYSLFDWPNASFEFRLKSRHQKPLIPTALPIEFLVWEGMRRHEETSEKSSATWDEAPNY